MHDVLIVAAGTGGHLYPGIATGRVLSASGSDVLFAVRRGDMGRALLEREGFKVMEISGQGLPRAFSLKTVSFPFKTIAGFFQAWSALGVLKPHVVLGMGGYLSFSVLLAARLRGIPSYIHEANVLPGLANRILARWVTGIAISFPESAAYFPKGKTSLSGLPVRAELGTVTAEQGRRSLGLDPQKFTLLVFGGSLGARRLNEVVVETLSLLASSSIPFQVMHVTGETDYTIRSKRYSDSKVFLLPPGDHRADAQMDDGHPSKRTGSDGGGRRPDEAVVRQGQRREPHPNSLPVGEGVHVSVLPYCHDMAAAYAAADLVICRAGASTVAELMVVQKPAILIPYPYASENHQLYNAEILVKRGLAEAILEKDLTAEALAKRVKSYLLDAERRNQWKRRWDQQTDLPLHRQAAERLSARLKPSEMTSSS